MKRMNAAAMMACLALAACSEGPDKVVRSFDEDVAAGRTSEALARFDPELKQAASMKIMAALEDHAAKAKSSGGLKEVQVVGTTRVDDTHATVRTETRFGDGSVAREESNARKVDGRWYVTM